MKYPKPRILILDQAEFIGGAELFVSDLLNNINLKEFEIHLACNNNPAYLELIPAQVFVHHFSPPKLNSKNPISYFRVLKSVQNLNKIIKQNQIDIVQSNTIRTHLLNALSKSPKKIWFIHDFTFPSKICRFLASKPDKILCCSEIVKKDISKKINPKHHSKLQTIYNGVSLSSPPPKTSAKNKPPLVGLVGRIDWWKGQKELILAAKKVLKQIPTAQFYIFGAPNQHDPKTLEYSQEIKDLVKNLQLEKSIIFKGHTKNILSEISNLDLLVHTSTQPEPFGRVIIEAMSVHTPVIASPLGGTQEIIQDQTNGLLINPHNTNQLAKGILDLLKNSNLAHQYSQAAYQTIENKFTLEHTSYQIQQIWYRILS